MKKLVILRGNSGSGKTTVARVLQRKIGFNTMLISQDEIRRNMLRYESIAAYDRTFEIWK